MPTQSQPHVAILGSYIPRRCGIATFTHDVATAIAGNGNLSAPSTGGAVSIVAMNDRDGKYVYGPEVLIEIHQQRREDYRNAADVLNTSRIDVISLQHEYGLFGGDCGDYLFEFLDRLQKPVVTTLHSVVSEPSPMQKEVLQRIGKRSSAVIVMANRAKMLLTEVYGVESDRIRLIPHGVPDVPFGDTEPFKERFGLSGRPMILTFGLLGPGKGIETVLEALGKVAPDHPGVAYIVLGVTHPSVKRESGELYRIGLERRAVELGIQENVFFHNRYVSNEDLREYLQAADIYITPYRHKEQITSGTLAYALACGKAIISTPYWHAQELLINGRGRLVEFDDADGFAANIRELIEDDKTRNAIRKAAYDFGRSMVWPRVGEQYRSTLEHACRTFPDTSHNLLAGRKVLMRLSLPEPRLDHLLAMTDDTGLLQHALYATPDRRHGYCTDDNARALIVTSMARSLFQREKGQPPLGTYLSFLHHAQNPTTGRFRNFMSFDRRWMEEDGSDDCQGRAIWALGYLISHPPGEATQRLATDMFRAAVRSLEGLRWPRSWALSILGLHYYLREFADDVAVREQQGMLADRLNAAFAEHASEDWPWFEDVVTYDNGRLPQALIVAGLGLQREELVDRGQRVLQWLFDIQTARDGHLSVIGNKGWLRRSGTDGNGPKSAASPAESPCHAEWPRAVYDQQALEPAALIGACKAAYRASGDGKWLIEMRRCFEWYVGRNDLGLSMVDFKSRGCFDGLKESGVNENQGAESVLSWLLSILIMYEMQTGDAPEGG